MAAFNRVIRVDAVALVAATLKTLLQLVAPTHQRLKIKEIGISFAGAYTDLPVLVDALFQTTAGTSSALSGVSEDTSLTETGQATALQTFTVEPTAGNIVRSWKPHPMAPIIYCPPEHDPIIVGGGKRFGLRVNAPAIQSATAYIRFEE